MGHIYTTFKISEHRSRHSATEIRLRLNSQTLLVLKKAEHFQTLLFQYIAAEQDNLCVSI